MKIAIGNDHAGTTYKKAVVRQLKEQGHQLIDHGTHDEDSVDYPDFVHPVAQDVSANNAQIGIIICGSGNGANMTANKHQKVRSALCWNEEIVKLARQHNDANVLSIPARFVSIHQTLRFVELFLSTEFEGGRHIRRVEKIPH
ncbi:MAG: ribose 5-phosphate isomerase B [Psychroflexus sp.]|nr:ribose 5-phosphate isomerase B [Psychroflexus sp.]MDR9447899.1 ribose 5-phosphate isomerase B [Psychroflexus sp.]